MKEIDDLSMTDRNALADLIGITVIFLTGGIVGFALSYLIFEVL